MALPMLSEAQKEDIRKESKDYIISVDPAIDEIDSPSYGYVYVADMTKTPMEILETYKITKNGLKLIKNDRAI